MYVCSISLRSPVCVRWCTFKFDNWPKSLSQMLHRYSYLPFFFFKAYGKPFEPLAPSSAFGLCISESIILIFATFVVVVLGSNLILVSDNIWWLLLATTSATNSNWAGGPGGGGGGGGKGCWMAPRRRAAFDAVGGCMATVGHLWPLGDSGTCGRETCAELIIIWILYLYQGLIIISVKNN